MTVPSATAGDAFGVDDWTKRWAASGAAGLSGRADGPPLDVPIPMLQLAERAAEQIASVSARIGTRVALDGLAALGERAALMGLARHGDVSCGGATRLLPAGDGWIAVSLARDSDIASVPAWLEAAVPQPGAGSADEELWAAVRDAAKHRSAAEMVERATLLGMPVARLGEVAAPNGSVHRPASAHRTGTAAQVASMADVVVVDLSALWAGPLAASLLGMAGARVIKVESAQRPDGARLGPIAFYDLLHGGHESVCLDFADPLDIGVLRRLVERADVVIESSRPRALQQLGVDRAHVEGPRVWLTISSHGRDEAWASRVGFGDDAAIAGGLVTRDDRGPCFCVDAVADPLSGMVAAAATLDALGGGDRWTIDVALARTAAAASTGRRTSVSGHELAAPRARTATARAAALGADTASVVAELTRAR